MLHGLAADAAPGRVEAAAALLADVMEIAGKFAAARFERDAAPLLLRLMGSGGVSSKPGVGGVNVRCRYLEEEASGSRARRQSAALLCIERCCKSAQGREAVVRLVERLAVSAVECMGDQGGFPEGSVRCVRALAAVDPDAVWLVVVRVVHVLQPELLPKVAEGPELGGLVGRGGGVQKRGDVQVAARCMRLLREIDGMDVGWHADVRRARAARHMDAEP
jgi:hypothetical protein